MPVYSVVRRLRVPLCANIRRGQLQHVQGQTFTTSACTCTSEIVSKSQNNTHDFEKRLAQLQSHTSLSACYPRLPPGFGYLHVPLKQFREANQNIQTGDDAAQSVVVVGRIQSLRSAGSKLVFITLRQDETDLQVLCELKKLQEKDVSLTLEKFKDLFKVARKGDYFSIEGHAHRTPRGELSLKAERLPTLVSPSLHQIPEGFDDPEARMKQRHVTMLVDPKQVQTLKIRHYVETCLQRFLDDRGFVKVLTPIIGAGAGGALARAFETQASELNGEKLSLRIAPELWLKRLIIGGLPKIYEIGPAFRNEGVDASHNPEFNICEFYEAYATLDDLMKRTEELFSSISEFVRSRISQTNSDFAPPQLAGPFTRLEFIPTVEQEMACSLPDLSSEDSLLALTALFEKKQMPLPINPTLPRLLDALAERYIEPLCDQPTFITHHPAVMSPLSKHFICSSTGQTVAARAEFFIRGREYANMYEEENSPFEQRRKFELQLIDRGTDPEAMELDESYLQALEWALPPTGGWGCGLDRLVMLFSGCHRIADVLAFGTLRNVVALQGSKKHLKQDSV